MTTAGPNARTDSHFLTATQPLQHHRLDNNIINQQLASLSDSNRKPRQARKPSPGLAARLRALGFGKNSNGSTPCRSPTHDRIGRIPEDQIQKLDLIHRANSVKALQSPSIHSRGRAWSGTSGHLTPQVTGGSFTSYNEIPPIEFLPQADLSVFEEGTQSRVESAASEREEGMSTRTEEIDMDSQKSRLPEHTNGNGTQAMLDTKQAHIERDIPPDDETPPPPIAKDTPPGGTAPGEFQADSSSYFNPFRLQRPGSIYTLSRVSFASQLAQLTSLQLPDAESLSTKVSAIPTSVAASKALMGAAEQIRSWISKASEVVSGLDGEDDVEWAAAGGREGLEEVDNAIVRFTELINVYVSAIESLQSRPDIASVSADELRKVVLQVETILSEWENIRRTLKGVKNSVELAMEWEELWNIVLGDIGNEMDVLARLVFEMEEKRHRSLMAETGADGGVDLNELETIVEETPPSKTKLAVATRFSVPGTSFPLSPSSPHPAALSSQDDSSLLALFARMQPLRASLDFLPMRLSNFHHRAEKIFPTACQELETRRAGLEGSWKNLEKDAESLRRELGEDRWVLVFRGAGRQAQKMYESVNRSVTKLKEVVESGIHLQSPGSMGKKIESYEAKKMHYGPAIERVLSIIERGVKDRLTVNGEILRLHSEMHRKWDALKEQMSELDTSLEEIQADKKNQQLRDSISSMLSNDRSTLGSHYDTPGSSPASSVVLSGVNSGVGDMATPVKNGKVRSGSSLPKPGARRVSNPGASQLPRKGLTNRLSTIAAPVTRASPSPASSRQGSATPTGNRLPRPSSTHNPDGRPRWNSSVIIQDNLTGHNFKPLSLTTPSPHVRTKPPSAHANRHLSVDSKLPLRSPLSRENTASPAPESTPSRKSHSRAGTRRTSPGPYSQQVLSQNSLPTRPRMLTSKSSTSNLANSTNRRASFQPQASDPNTFSSPLSKASRPMSSLATNRRVSLLPQPRGRQSSGSNVTGRETPQVRVGSAMRTNSRMGTSGNGHEKKPWK
ncbi:karyogamy protein [Drepanopeziza brunnea f. sp. 'multigermtubi' MB_m1]|uniref:Karyogamy protein n=1 Tax=Marssonina brunnea f. sp. multigermtubi (strain MB_m1) TaxID=1072389 RepID=K1XSK5_MARBU|nr:karyogamy protein [Drepanopeziza brunnea f. sp. 'multigermtubi' MB_m1]EKD15514.1 karyogamy protein [Drepanopeziza brunnea f. sp. 'multigermtubi' MB_m1]